MPFDMIFGSSQDLPYIQDADNDNMSQYPRQILQEVAVDGSNHYYHLFDENLIDPTLAVGDLGPLTNPQQQSSQHPMSRFVQEHERTLFTIPQFSSEAGPAKLITRLGQQAGPVASLPPTYAYQNRLTSPSPSNGLTSNSSSAQSPACEPDPFYDPSFYSPHSQVRDEFSFGDPTHFTQPSWTGYPTQPTPSYPRPQHGNDNFIQMSQIQGFQSPEEVNFDINEGYGGTGTEEYNLDAPLHSSYQKMEGDRSYYDEGLGSSIAGAHTPRSMAPSHHSQEIDDTEMDAEGDPSDTEYSPRRSRPRRSAIKPQAALSAKTRNNRVSKAAAPLRRTKQISHATHERAFACVFSFAGCPSTFGSKNEWKRHVSSQHLNLTAWVCKQGSCNRVHNRSVGYHRQRIGTEFNRKDLFTQHVRRMHTPVAVKQRFRSASGNGKTDPEFEATLKVMQTQSLIHVREGPSRLQCIVPDCGKVFGGDTTKVWDERMEHMGKHLESGNYSGAALRNENDQFLINWALIHKIIERDDKAASGFRLTLAPSSGVLGHPTPRPAYDRSTRTNDDGDNEDDDAEGDDDF